MAAPKITLYVDIVSPFSYMAFYAVKVSFPAARLESLGTELCHAGVSILHLSLIKDPQSAAP